MYSRDSVLYSKKNKVMMMMMMMMMMMVHVCVKPRNDYQKSEDDHLPV